MRIFADAFVAALNAQHSGGKFLKAAVFKESDSLTRYYVSHDDTIVFQGNTYQMMPMAWEGISFSHTMNLPAVRLVLPNFDGSVSDFLEAVDITGREVILQILHIDTLGLANAYDQIALRVMTVDGDESQGFVSVNLGLNLALEEMLPRGVITREEFPGVPNNLRVATIL